MQTLRQLFPINATDKRAGLFLTPDNFPTAPANSIPLIIFWHGVDEAKPDNISDVNFLGDPIKSTGLYANGSPLAQAVAGRLNSITCPVTGKVYTPAIFALQGISQPDGSFPWCVSAADMAYAIRQLLSANPQLDYKGMLATGLSAGGQTAWEALGGPDCSLYAAAVPMSTPATDGRIEDWTRAVGKAWAFHGTSDTGNLTNIANSIYMVGQVNTQHPGFALLTQLPGGHDQGVWSFAYNPGNRWPFTFAWDGKTPTSKSINIYEFWLACRNSNFLFSSATGGGSVVNIQPASTTKAIPTITIVGNTVTMDASASTGNLGSYDWYVTSSTGAYFNLSGMGLHPDQKKVVAIMPNGTYNVRLTVQDYSSAKDVATTTITVPAAPAGPTAVATFTVAGVTHTAYSDGTWK